MSENHFYNELTNSHTQLKHVCMTRGILVPLLFFNADASGNRRLFIVA